MAPQQGMDESLSQAVGTSAEMYLRKGKNSCKEARREQKECNTAEGRPRSEKEEKVLLHMPGLTDIHHTAIHGWPHTRASGYLLKEVQPMESSYWSRFYFPEGWQPMRRTHDPAGEKWEMAEVAKRNWPIEVNWVAKRYWPNSNPIPSCSTWGRTGVEECGMKKQNWV